MDPPKKLCGTQCNFSSKIAKLLCSNPFFQQRLPFEKNVMVGSPIEIPKYSLHGFPMSNGRIVHELREFVYGITNIRFG